MEKYIYIIVPVFTLALCQFIKFTIESVKNKHLVWGRLFNGNGGMPSSHTSFSFSLTCTIMLMLGFSSPLFAISLVFSFITAYDSMGLRRESGKQAEAINTLLDELFEKNNTQGFKKLKEQLGHKPLEVLMGMVLGLVTSSFFVSFIK